MTALDNMFNIEIGSMILAAFIVFVSFRHYQESSERDVWVKNREVGPRNDTVSVSSKLKRQY